MLLGKIYGIFVDISELNSLFFQAEVVYFTTTNNMENKMLWNSETGVVTGETGMFLGKNVVRLLFPAEKILKVYNSTLDTVYEAGKDFTHESGSDLLYVTADTAIPVLPEEALYPPPEKSILFPDPDANAITGGPDGKNLIFSRKNFFAAHQVEIDYQAAAGTVFPDNPTLKEGQLPRFTSLLKAGKNVSITLIGDSISAGSNSTKQMNCPPYAPPYIETVAAGLEKRFGGKVEVRNSAIGGTGCRQAFDIEDTWLDKPCDLLIIAYGMNDFAHMSGADYKATLKKIIDKMHAAHPETEFLLVTSMTGNPNWRSTVAGPDVIFAEELRTLASDTVAVADVRPFWVKILERKDFYDMTGNGVNHPNDHGYRVYAKVFLDLFR